ncbi:DNA polymerase ligase N-terminal domain-containing protein [Chelativorans alearense]|uniref:DNA polymerase ligase N-terminal domain-containing protein n=1 Tax=Chelativorans alearense TaxID=2681495 RepID=UPI0013D5AEDB|nr:DNA polymerase ligase N-terminal domain-containing protein [Chelativorans alearense]
MAIGSEGDSLKTYRAKRRFDVTPEPNGKARGRPKRRKGGIYAVQKHAARSLHYDLRLELDGVLKSWAITRGPSLDPAEKRLAVSTEDHPLEYATFEGNIPKDSYGAGTVLLWDEGTWMPRNDPYEGLNKGKLTFEIYGKRLRGRWALVRLRGKKSGHREDWLLIKADDEEADDRRDVTSQHKTSIASGRRVEDIAATAGPDRTGSETRTGEDQVLGKTPHVATASRACLIS